MGVSICIGAGLSPVEWHPLHGEFGQPEPMVEPCSYPFKWNGIGSCLMWVIIPILSPKEPAITLLLLLSADKTESYLFCWHTTPLNFNFEVWSHTLLIKICRNAVRCNVRGIPKWLPAGLSWTSSSLYGEKIS